MPAIIGRRVELIIPVGLEKKVFNDIPDLVMRVLAIETDGPRLMQLPGKIFTELDAIPLLTGAEAFQIAGGGVYGAEGSAWLGISGTDEQIQATIQLLEDLKNEPACQV